MPYKNRQDALDYAKKYRTNPETRKNIKDGQRAWYLQEGDRIKQKKGVNSWKVLLEIGVVFTKYSAQGV